VFIVIINGEFTNDLQLRINTLLSMCSYFALLNEVVIKFTIKNVYLNTEERNKNILI